MYKVRQDYILIALILLLILLGLATLCSASFLFAANHPLRFKNGWSPLVSNLIACGIMLAVFPFTALLSLDKLKNGKVVIFLVALTILLNILPTVSLFQKINHRKGIDVMRWIVLKANGKEFLSFQPSELFKVALPLYLAYILDKNQDRLNSFAYGFLPPVIITTLFCGLVLWQSNFSEAVLILIISLVICFVAGIRLGWFCLGLTVPFPIVYLLLTLDKEGRWYQRFISYISKKQDLSGADYQISMGLKAIREGGFWGKGIGQGTLKVRIPEVHGDFVFAAYIEEFGLLGVLVYLLLIGAFVYIGCVTAFRSRDRFKQLLAFGLVTAIAVQTLTNIAVVVKLIPTTGIPLPFVSSGGSSLLMTLVASGLLVNISRSNIKSGIGGHYVR